MPPQQGLRLTRQPPGPAPCPPPPRRRARRLPLPGLRDLPPVAHELQDTVAHQERQGARCGSPAAVQECRGCRGGAVGWCGGPTREQLPHPLPPQVADISVQDAQKNFKKSMEKGILKIMSKMGISLLSCYHGAQIFEIYGLGRDVVDLCFRGSVSRIGGCPRGGGALASAAGLVLGGGGVGGAKGQARPAGRQRQAQLVVPAHAAAAAARWCQAGSVGPAAGWPTRVRPPHPPALPPHPRPPPPRSRHVPGRPTARDRVLLGQGLPREGDDQAGGLRLHPVQDQGGPPGC
jgi:hypothetical protein